MAAIEPQASEVAGTPGDMKKLRLMSRDEAAKVFAGLKEWIKFDYDRGKDYQKVVVAGIVLLVVTFGLNLDKLTTLGWFGKGALIVSFILFFTAAVGTHIQQVTLHDAMIKLCGMEGQYIISGLDEIAVESVDAYRKSIFVNSDLSAGSKWGLVAHVCIVCAIIVASIVFFVIICVS